MVKAGSRPRSANVIGALVLMTVSLIVSAVVLEVLLRMMGYGGAPVSALTNTYGVADPVLDWRYTPESEMRIGRIVYRFNRAGFRDVDHPVEKVPGTRRIVVLGDSVTEGYGVSLDEMFTARVRSALGASWDVMNVAAGGLNTAQEVHLLEREGLAYRPDLVVVNFVMNDPEAGSRREAARQYDAAKASQIGLVNIPVDPEIKRALKSSALVYFVKERVEHLIGLATGKHSTDYYTELLSRDEGRVRVARAFDRLAELQKENGFDVAVMIWPLLTEYADYRFRFAHEWVASEAASRGFSVIDLLDRFSGLSYRGLQVTAEDNIHPNAEGHRVGAEAFAAWHASRRWEHRR